MIRLRPSGADEVLIKRVRDWYEPGPGVFIAPQALFNPALLFTSGVNGTWYDPSDLNTLFQDAAGTTPVTAVEQPVGLMLDKSSRGNHAFNPSGNSANFPVLSARYNLLTKTEQFDDAVWGKNGATVSANSIIAPDGTLTADKLIENSATSEHVLTSASYTVPATSATVLIYAKAAGRTSFLVDFRSVDAGQGRAVFDLSAVTATVQIGSGASATITAVGDGWFRCVFTATLAANTSSAKIALVSGGTSNYTGNGTSGIYIWGADLRVSNDALNQPAYQRVNTATDYDTVGFKPYLKFNGTNQWLQTNSIDFSYGDKMFVCAGVRKLSDAARGMLFEAVSGASGVNLNAPRIAGTPNYEFASSGTTQVTNGTNSYAAPTTNVVSGIGDISAPLNALRVNGALLSSVTTTQGTGNYSNAPLYIGARAGSSFWFNGRLYQLVVAGKQASDSEIGQTEAFTNTKTGAY